jgi:hypothetical protein
MKMYKLFLLPLICFLGFYQTAYAANACQNTTGTVFITHPGDHVPNDLIGSNVTLVVIGIYNQIIAFKSDPAPFNPQLGTGLSLTPALFPGQIYHLALEFRKPDGSIQYYRTRDASLACQGQFANIIYFFDFYRE